MSLTPSVVLETEVNLCSAQPEQVVDPSDPFLPEPDSGVTSAPAPPLSGASAPVTESELEAAIAVVRANPERSDAMADQGSVVRLADPWIDNQGLRRGVVLTVAFEQATELPVEDQAYVTVPDSTPNDSSDDPEASEIEHDENGVPELETTTEGEFLFDAVRVAWFTVDLIDSSLFLTEVTQSPDYDPCPWDQ